MARALEEVQGQWRQNLVQTGLKARERNFTQYKQPEISEQTRTLGAKPEEIKASEEQKWNSVKRVSKKSLKKKKIQKQEGRYGHDLQDSSWCQDYHSRPVTTVIHLPTAKN